MARKRRGDDEPKGSVEVPANEDGFPVSAAPAPEADSDDTTAADPADGAGEAGDDAVADAPATDAPLLKVNFDFHREFRRHGRTGDLVAIELVNGVLAGVRRCSKPEEQTAGALPVMALEGLDSDVGQWYRAEQTYFQTWEPPPLPKALMKRLRDLYEQAVTVRSNHDRAKLAAKHAKERVEEVDEAIFHALRRMHDVGDQAELPLEPTPVEEQPEPELPLGDTPDEVEGRAGDSSVETAEPLAECVTCDGTGYICKVCEFADGNCVCENGPDLVPCPEGHEPEDDAERRAQDDAAAEHLAGDSHT